MAMHRVLAQDEAAGDLAIAVPRSDER